MQDVPLESMERVSPSKLEASQRLPLLDSHRSAESSKSVCWLGLSAETKSLSRVAVGISQLVFWFGMVSYVL